MKGVIDLVNASSTARYFYSLHGCFCCRIKEERRTEFHCTWPDCKTRPHLDQFTGIRPSRRNVRE